MPTAPLESNAHDAHLPPAQAAASPRHGALRPRHARHHAHRRRHRPAAHVLEYPDLAGAVLAEPLRPVDGKVTARGPGLGMIWDEEAVTPYTVG